MKIVKISYEHKDQFALVLYYKKITKKVYQKKIKEAYNVQFLERPVKNILDFVEQ